MAHVDSGRLPDDKLAWQPHAKSMSLGGLATHLSNLPNWGSPIMNESAFDLAGAPPPLEAKPSRADILAAFDAAARQTRTLLDKTDAELMAPWSLRRRRLPPACRSGTSGLRPPPSSQSFLIRRSAP